MVILYFVLSNYVPTKTEIDPAVYYYCLWHTPSAILSNAKAEGSHRLNGGANLRLVRFPPSLVPNTVDPPRVFFKWESGKFLFLENCYTGCPISNRGISKAYWAVTINMGIVVAKAKLVKRSLHLWNQHVKKFRMFLSHIDLRDFGHLLWPKY